MIVIFENIEYHLDLVFFLILFNRIDRDLRGYVVWEMKLACADTAERHAFQVFLYCFIQTGEVTAFEQFAIILGESAANDRSHRVDYILTGQIISRSDLRLTGRFLMSLRFHQLITGIA